MAPLKSAGENWKIPKRLGNGWSLYLFFGPSFLSGVNFICCVFWPAFGCWAHPKAGWNIYLAVFQPFLFFLKLFQWFHNWNQQKTSENEQKTWCCLLLNAGRHAKAGRLLEGYPEIVFFWLIFCWKKCFDQLLGARSTQELVETHNIHKCLTLSPRCKAGFWSMLSIWD